MASVTQDVVEAAAAEDTRAPQPYANPYLAGIGLGLVLLAAFVLVGRGLGASGAFNALIAWLVSLVAPAYARSNEFLGDYLVGDTHPLKAWLVFEVVGVLVGGSSRACSPGASRAASRRARASRSRLAWRWRSPAAR